MRIALVHMRHAATGGTERYLNQLSAHLARAGHEVTVVCRSHAEPAHPALRFAVLRPAHLGKAWRRWAFARDVGRHVRAARYDLVYALGKTFTHDVIRLGGGCHRTYLERAHRAERGPLARRLDPGWLQHRVALAIERRALAPGAWRRIVTNSRMVERDVVERYGADPERVRVVYNGVDLERFGPAARGRWRAALRERWGVGPDERVVLFLGSGYARKGLDVVLEAFARLAPEREGLRLVVVGRDSRAARYRARAERLGIAARCRFAGGTREPEASFAAADVYALPTRYDPFANATLEALASGLPVVTSAANGGSELIEPGVEGSVLERADDADALADALGHWLAPERAAAGGAAARRRAERHGVGRAMAESLAVLEEVARELGRDPRPAPGTGGDAGDALVGGAARAENAPPT